MKSYEPQFRSKRIFESLKCEITSLPQHWNDAVHTSSHWGTDAVIKHVTDIEISCEKSKLVSLRNPPRKGFYIDGEIPKTSNSTFGKCSGEGKNCPILLIHY